MSWRWPPRCRCTTCSASATSSSWSAQRSASTALPDRGCQPRGAGRDGRPGPRRPGGAPSVADFTCPEQPTSPTRTAPNSYTTCRDAEPPRALPTPARRVARRAPGSRAGRADGGRRRPSPALVVCHDGTIRCPPTRHRRPEAPNVVVPRRPAWRAQLRWQAALRPGSRALSRASPSRARVPHARPARHLEARTAAWPGAGTRRPRC